MRRAVSMRAPVGGLISKKRILFMNMSRKCVGLAGKSIIALLVVGLSLAATPQARGSTEESFDVLQAGTRTYRNVTVTTKAKQYIFILHSEGMTNLKVSELPPEVKAKLGYADVESPKRTNNAVAVWAKQQMAKVDGPQLKAVEDGLAQRMGITIPAGQDLAAQLREIVTPDLVLNVGGACLVVYLFFCYCSLLICRKAGTRPGVLVWVPVLQLIPLLRAAGMSGWWLVGYLVPLLNVIAQIRWSFKIAEARGKTFWTGLMLLLPVTNILAFLYLAFSSGPEPKAKEHKRIEIMTLETC